MPAYRYLVCGFLVASELRLPELLPWTGDDEREPDIVLAIGAIDAGLKDPAGRAVLGPDRYIQRVDNAGWVLVEGGRRLIVDPFDGVCVDVLRLLLVGTAQAVLWYQRGLVPFHASAVLRNGQAVAVAARSGHGKSVLAGALVRAGFPLLSDDFVVLRLDPERPVMLPGYQRLRLWHDACIALGFEDHIIGRADAHRAKWVVEVDIGPLGPAALADVLVVQNGPLELRRLGPVEAFQELSALLHCRGIAAGLGRQRLTFFGPTSLMQGGTRVWLASYPHDLATIGEHVRWLFASLGDP